MTYRRKTGKGERNHAWSIAATKAGKRKEGASHSGLAFGIVLSAWWNWHDPSETSAGSRRKPNPESKFCGRGHVCLAGHGSNDYERITGRGDF